MRSMQSRAAILYWAETTVLLHATVVGAWFLLAPPSASASWTSLSRLVEALGIPDDLMGVVLLSLGLAGFYGIFRQRIAPLVVALCGLACTYTFIACIIYVGSTQGDRFLTYAIFTLFCVVRCVQLTDLLLWWRIARKRRSAIKHVRPRKNNGSE